MKILSFLFLSIYVDSYFAKFGIPIRIKCISTFIHYKKPKVIIACFNSGSPFDQHLQFHLSHQEVQASPERETEKLIIHVWK